MKNSLLLDDFSSMYPGLEALFCDLVITLHLTIDALP